MIKILADLFTGGHSYHFYICRNSIHCKSIEVINIKEWTVLKLLSYKIYDLGDQKKAEKVNGWKHNSKYASKLLKLSSKWSLLVYHQLACFLESTCHLQLESTNSISNDKWKLQPHITIARKGNITRTITLHFLIGQRGKGGKARNQNKVIRMQDLLRSKLKDCRICI